MIWYKTSKNDDPYNELWSRKEWLYPIENADKMRFPLVVTVEPTNACQNNCLYCSRSIMNRETGYLKLGIMEKIAKESSENNAAIRHGGFGEPLLHPNIVDIIARCKKHNVLTTIFSNCKPLTDDMMKAFVDLGLDEIRFSSSGITPEEHNKIRVNSDYYKDFHNKLIRMFEIREKLNAKKPYLTLYTNVMDYDSKTFTENIEQYKDEYIQYADKIDIDLTMLSRVKELDRVKDLYVNHTVKEVHKRCTTLFLKVIVQWNGDIFGCDCVYNYEPDFHIGNICNTGSAIKRSYNSQKMHKLRNALSFNMNHDKYKLCSCCYSNTNKWDTNTTKSMQSLQPAI